MGRRHGPGSLRVSLASLLSPRAHATPQVLALRPLPSLPLSSENPYNPKFLHLRSRFLGSLSLGVPLPLPRAPYRAQRAGTKVLREDLGSRGGAGDGASDRGVSAEHSASFAGGNSKAFSSSALQFPLPGCFTPTMTPTCGASLPPCISDFEEEEVDKQESYLLLTEHLLA